jgi:hypothetical protein
VRFRCAAQPRLLASSDLTPMPAWTAPRVGQDERGRPPWTLLDLGLAFRAAHPGFDFPELSVGADEDVTACKPDITIPPVLLNSHPAKFRTDIDGPERYEVREFLAVGSMSAATPALRGAGACHNPHVLGRFTGHYSS